MNLNLLRDLLEPPRSRRKSHALRIACLWLLTLAVVLAVAYFSTRNARAGESWPVPAVFQGERSTVELDCEEIGLFLAPWGVDGSSIRCISRELMEKEPGQKGRYWRPSRIDFMHRYCGFHHGTSMVHYDPVTYIFWCAKTAKPKGHGA